MLGVPLLMLYLVVHHFIPEENLNAELLVLAIPSIVFTYKWEKKCEQMLKDGTK